jgi:hypothetical protein
VITVVDFERLESVLDSPRYRSKQAPLLMSLREELDRGTVVPSDAVPVATMHSWVRGCLLQVCPSPARANSPRLDLVEMQTRRRAGKHVIVIAARFKLRAIEDMQVLVEIFEQPRDESASPCRLRVKRIRDRACRSRCGSK